jgi:hypothetical protein
MQYHLYSLDERGKIRADEWFEADCDEEAIAKVRSMKQPYLCELWDERKQLARIPPHWKS